mgnify:CR=1 FL=1
MPACFEAQVFEFFGAFHINFAIGFEPSVAGEFVYRSLMKMGVKGRV